MLQAWEEAAKRILGATVELDSWASARLKEQSQSAARDGTRVANPRGVSREACAALPQRIFFRVALPTAAARKRWCCSPTSLYSLPRSASPNSSAPWGWGPHDAGRRTSWVGTPASSLILLLVGRLIMRNCMHVNE